MTDEYELDFKCGNCGKEFSKSIEKGYKVERRRSRGDTVILPDGSYRVGDHEYLECPKCETGNKIIPQR